MTIEAVLVDKRQWFWWSSRSLVRSFSMEWLSTLTKTSTPAIIQTVLVVKVMVVALVVLVVMATLVVQQVFWQVILLGVGTQLPAASTPALIHYSLKTDGG